MQLKSIFLVKGHIIAQTTIMYVYIYYVFISRFGSNMDNKNSIEIEELRPELPISNYLSGNELLAFENVKDNVCYHCGKSFSEEKISKNMEELKTMSVMFAKRVSHIEEISKYILKLFMKE